MSEQTTQQEHASVPDIDALVASDSKRYVVLSNGAVKDMRNGGKFVTMDASRNPYAITKENTQDMHKLRRERTQASILTAIEEGTGAINWQVGVTELSKCLVKIIQKEGNRSVEAWLALLKGAGLIEDKRSGQSSDVPAGGMTLNIGAEALATILEKAQERLRELDDQVIDV